MLKRKFSSLGSSTMYNTFGNVSELVIYENNIHSCLKANILSSFCPCWLTPGCIPTCVYVSGFSSIIIAQILTVIKCSRDAQVPMPWTFSPDLNENDSVDCLPPKSILLFTNRRSCVPFCHFLSRTCEAEKCTCLKPTAGVATFQQQSRGKEAILICTARGGEAHSIRTWESYSCGVPWQVIKVLKPYYLSWAQCNHMSLSFLELRKTL